MNKSVHSIILDASPILNNTPTISSLLNKGNALFTVPDVINEIKDANARHRLEATILPFLTIKSPKPESVRFVSEFSRKTGDYTVLSRPDIHILALAYELECEQSDGDWRLRNAPGQKGVNDPPPKQSDDVRDGPRDNSQNTQSQTNLTLPPNSNDTTSKAKNAAHGQSSSVDQTLQADPISRKLETSMTVESGPTVVSMVQSGEDELAKVAQLSITEPESDASESDSEGWITPSNLKKRQAEDLNASLVPTSDTETMQVATITGDFAMQVSR